MGNAYKGNALLGLHIPKARKELLLQEAKCLVYEEVKEQAIAEAKKRIVAEICEDPDTHADLFKFVSSCVRPLIQSEWLGYGMQVATDGFLAALGDKGWRSGRAVPLLESACEYIEEMSMMLLTEHDEAIFNQEADADPVYSKYKIDASLEPVYGEKFVKWDERYKSAGQSVVERTLARIESNG